jgi:hypothetical protein
MSGKRIEQRARLRDEQPLLGISVFAVLDVPWTRC